MTDTTPFALLKRNPDVLTCIANLSNDEVFTPPEFAARMLDTLAEGWASANDGANLWADSSATFLDPCTKSGVFLREIAKRLIDGLADKIPDLQARVDHILTKQLFGIGITRLTALLARRSLYCSKWANGEHSVARSFDSEDGNIWFERTEHEWQGDKCHFCGAPRSVFDRAGDLETHAYAFLHTSDPRVRLAEIFGENMQFDVIIGNPPYQLDDGGHGTSAAPIYDRFVTQAKALDPRFLTMVIPSRWFAGGRGLDDFRREMISDDQIRSIDDYLTASDVFPGVGLKGGVCYFLREKGSSGPCNITTHFKDWPDSAARRPLRENGADILIRFNEGLSILKKVTEKEGAEKNSVALPSERRFDVLVSSLRPFGLRTFFKAKSTPQPDDVLVHQNGGRGYMARADIQVGVELIDAWKIYIGRAAPGTGNKDSYPHKVISTPFIGGPGSISTETYLCIGPFPDKMAAENALSYLKCKLTRMLILLHKAGQDTTRKVYTFVPKQDWSKPWSDAELYARYGLTNTEIAFIEKIVRPMEASD